MKKNHLVFVLFILCWCNANAQFNFKPFQTYSAGNNIIPVSVATGDFNNDGKPDIAAANWFGNSKGIFILNNNGDGTFATPHFVSIASDNDDEPWFVSVGDLNGDSYPDMVTSNSTLSWPSSIGVFLNNGMGGFEPPAFYVSGYRPDKAIIQDFNGDNKPDIVAANRQDSFISVYMNNGDGSFAPQVTYFNGYVPGAIATDFNNDGKMDLVVRSFLENTPTSDAKISVMLNDGNGNFTTSSIDTVSGYIQLSEVADLNNDTKPDLIMAYFGVQKHFLISLNNGDGTFAAPDSYVIDQYVSVNTIVAVDMNQDNKKDLVINSVNADYNYIYLNTGNGVFSGPIRVGKPHNASDLCVVDLNGDNKLDFINSAMHDSLITVTLQNKDATAVNTPELKKGNVSIFPNPGKNAVTILSSVNDQLKVYDLLGRLLMEHVIVKGNNTVDISSLSSGAYVFVVGTEKIKFEKKD